MKVEKYVIRIYMNDASKGEQQGWVCKETNLDDDVLKIRYVDEVQLQQQGDGVLMSWFSKQGAREMITQLVNAIKGSKYAKVLPDLHLTIECKYLEHEIFNGD